MAEQGTQVGASGEARFRELIEQASDGVLVLWSDGTIAYANPCARQLLGREEDELVGAMFGKPVSPGETAEIDVCRSHSGEGLCIMEMRTVEVEWEGRPALLATLRDVTSRRQADQALRFLSEASTQLARSLDTETTLTTVAELAVQHLADWCLLDLVESDLHDPPGYMLRRLVGHRDKQVGERIKELCGKYTLLGETVVGVGRVFRTCSPEVYHAPSELELLALALDPRRMKHFHDLGCRSALLVPMIARGRIIGSISFLSSTGLHVYDEETQALAENLAARAALAVDNARLYEEAQEALRRRDEFLAMLAHELRNPLAPILAACQLMKHGVKDAEAFERQRATIERQGQHLSRLLDDLLDLSRVTQGKIELRIQPVDLRTVVHDALQVAQQLMDERRHYLMVEVEPEPLIVEGDATRLAQIVGNLLTNAARYTDPGGRIEVRAYRGEKQVLVRVSDNGRGIHPEMLGKIFEPFTQLSTSLEHKEAGLGIGLTLVRRLVELHGGRVQVQSGGPGMGSTFEIRLPRSTACLPIKAKRGSGTRTPKKILLVEDNSDSRSMLGDLLRLWGHEVEAVGDGLAGLEEIGRDPPDAALIDIGLPKLDGYRVAERARSLPGTAKLLLVALTGYGMPEDRARALAAGFDEHLVKPVDLEQLIDLLERGRH